MKTPDPASRGGLSRRSLVIAIAALSLLLVALISMAVMLLRPVPPGASSNASSGAIRVAGGDLGGPFNLVDQNGQRVTEADFAGKYLLIYFGFTYCPDVCPTELQIMANALDELGPTGDVVQPILITVDPARDTPQQLRDYVAAFHPRLVGLTGSEEQIAAVAKAYRVYYAKTPPAADGSYNVDHTSFVYFMGPDGKLRSLFPASTSSEAMAKEIRAQLDAD